MDGYTLDLALSTALAIWTGEGSVTIGSTTYTGDRRLLSVSAQESALSGLSPEMRVRLSLDEDLADQLTDSDVGPLAGTVQYIETTDGGATWTTHWTFAGVVADTRMTAQQELEIRLRDKVTWHITTPTSITWEKNAHRQRQTGDQGFDYAAFWADHHTLLEWGR